MSRYHTRSSSRVSIGAEIGKGGEGTVYAVAGSSDLVAKIYTDGRAEDRRNKIEAMVNAGLHRQATHISFPIETLFDDKKRFVGFTMRKVKDALPIHQLWNSRDRQEKFPDATVAFMVRVATNVARAVAELHHTGCVIGDINESGFLVTKQATVILIDSDSIQYSSGSNIFPCVVGTPEYLPPEHQGINQRSLGPRSPNHDNFGAAVMIFRLLMSGTHPFGGIWKGRGDPPARPKWIEDFRYAYGANRHRMNVEPQPLAPPIDWLSDDIRSGFDRAFGRSGVQQRPSANDWIRMLDQFEGNLAQCRKSPFHQHRQNANHCPWCETEQKRKTELFGKPKPSFQQKPFAQSTTAGSASPNAAPRNSQRTRPSPPPRQSSSPASKTGNSGSRNALMGLVLAVILGIWVFGGSSNERGTPNNIEPSIDRATLEAERISSQGAAIFLSTANQVTSSRKFSTDNDIQVRVNWSGSYAAQDNPRIEVLFPNGAVSRCPNNTCQLAGQGTSLPEGDFKVSAISANETLTSVQFSVENLRIDRYPAILAGQANGLVNVSKDYWVAVSHPAGTCLQWKEMLRSYTLLQETDHNRSLTYFRWKSVNLGAFEIQTVQPAQRSFGVVDMIREYHHNCRN